MFHLRPVRTSAIALLLSLLLLGTPLPGSVAQAGPPIPASGSFTVASTTPTGVRSAGGNTVTTFETTLAITGTLSGTIVLQERLVTHANGRLNLHDEGTFTGTVDGRSGTLRIVANAVGDLSAYRGEFTILGGTGGLAGLRGHVAVAGIPAVSGTYSGQVHFEP
jgi:hypothetical protein